jgi:cyclohexanecarboxylate-CoA ligase
MTTTTHENQFLTARRLAMRQAGYWVDKTMDEFLDHALSAFPDKEALVAYRVDREQPVRLTYRQLCDRVERAANALRLMGVAHGDVVSVQLPNWWEFVVIALACGRVGAVINPLLHIFRERELSYMLDFAQSKVLIVPKVFRGFDFSAMAADLQQKLPLLEHVIVVDGEGENSFERALLSDKAGAAPASGRSATGLQPDDLAVLMFTSGTTGSPKGVMHSSNTLVACMNALSGRFGLTEDDVFMASTPVGHMTGYVAAVLIGLRQGGTVILQDVWEGKQGVALMVKEKVTYFAASTPFLNDICEVVAAGAPRPDKLRSFLCGGAPIPPAVIERAKREVNINVCSLWGMTEALSGTLTEPSRAADKSSTTDGRPLEGMEVRIGDDDGRPLPQGETGRLLVRGAQMFLGYYKQPAHLPFDSEGWFDSGDLAYLDAEGYIRISGRTKDVLIRGGENIPVVEIEGLLCKHPAVSAASIVGYPDVRLGERACAFVVVRQGQAFDLEALQAHLTACKVAKTYWPERVEILAQLPATPTGKIQKFKLKEAAKVFGDA